jgi:L-ascorbate 6-phosphate lactonase
MDETAKTGETLLADVRHRRIPEDALGIWWIGQSSFIVRGAGITLYLDPYLNPTPRRIVAPPLLPQQVTNADLILCTHDHGDHIDPTTLPGIAKASPQAKILVPGVARDRVVGMGIPASRVVVPPVDNPVSYGPLTVTAIPAAHEILDYAPERGYPYLGYIVKLNNVTLYHSGDCTIYEGLSERLKVHKPDVVLLPINGHDWKRTHQGIMGNMTYREAADLAVEVEADLAIPMHYGMFPHNTEPPWHFVDYIHGFHPTQKIKVMARYEGFVYLHQGRGGGMGQEAERARLVAGDGAALRIHARVRSLGDFYRRVEHRLRDARAQRAPEARLLAERDALARPDDRVLPEIAYHLRVSPSSSPCPRCSWSMCLESSSASFRVAPQ